MTAASYGAAIANTDANLTIDTTADVSVTATMQLAVATEFAGFIRLKHEVVSS